MKIHKGITVVIGCILLTLLAAAVFLPRERQKNKEAEIKIGAGDDISGVVMKETVKGLKKSYRISQTLESSSFQDCCSNTAQWVLNAGEINVGFYCPHVAKHTIEQNKEVEIYGPVIMNGETIIYKQAWEGVSMLGVTQGREQSKALAKETYPQIKGFHEITQKGILYAMEDEQIDAAILDMTKASEIPDVTCRPLSDMDYISYVLVVDKAFARTKQFADFIKSYNQAAAKLNSTEYLASVLGVNTGWLTDKNLKFLPLEETKGVD